MTSQTNVVILAAGLGHADEIQARESAAPRRRALTLIEHVVQAAAAIAPAEQRYGGGRASGRPGAGASGAFRRPFCRSNRAKRYRARAARLPSLARLRSRDWWWCSTATARCFRRRLCTELVRRQSSGNAAATLITTRLDDPTGYGRIVFGEQGEVRAIVEHKAATPAQLAIPFINSGIYCFRADLLWKHSG